MALIICISIIFLLICLWVGVKYLALITAKKNAYREFNKFCKELIIHYESILPALFASKKFMQNEKDTISETINFINKAKDFTIEKDGNERIIGYANAIFKNINDIIQKSDSYTNEKEAFYNALAKYNESKNNFDNEIKKYNHSAKTLKHYVDVFPSSLIARFLNIKTMDYIF